MRNTVVTKSLAILLNVALTATSFAAPTSAAAPAMPDMIKAFTPPAALGFVDSSYQGTTDRPVVLIQDLHANYKVQQKIESLLTFLQPQVAQGDRPMVLGIEGAWGRLDISKIRNVAAKPRRQAMDLLLKNAEISGMEHFAALTEKPLQFEGIDSPNDYLVHQELFKKSLAARLALASKVDFLRNNLRDAKSEAPASLKRVWRMSDRFREGKADLNDVSRALNVNVTNYGEAEAALSKAANDIANKESGEKGFFLRNIVAADQDLELLSRLLRQQLTLEEVQLASKRVPQMMVVLRGFLPGENMALWKDTIASAMDHYAVALLRDKPMAVRAEELVRKSAGSSVVLVTGGFHTAGIAEQLRRSQISYVVIAPVVESHTEKDERLYLKRMMGLHMSGAEIARGLKMPVTAHTVPAINGVASKGMLDGLVPGANVPSVVQSAAVVDATLNAAQTNKAPANLAVSEAEQDVAAAIDQAPVQAAGSATGVGAAIAGLASSIASSLRNLKRKLQGQPDNQQSADGQGGFIVSPKGAGAGRVLDLNFGKATKAIGVVVAIAASVSSAAGQTAQGAKAVVHTVNIANTAHTANNFLGMEPSTALGAGLVLLGTGAYIYRKQISAQIKQIVNSNA